MIRRARRADRIRSGLLGAVAIVIVAALPPSPSAGEPVAGSAGTDTTLPLTDSAATVRGRGEFDELEIVVNQTANLGNQAVSISWSGAEPTVRAGGADFAEHFLQVMQCWSEPGATGPEPEQCVAGATDGIFGGRNGALFGAGGFADDRVIARGDFESFDPDDGAFDPATNWLYRSFRSVTGATIGIHVNTSFSPAVESGDYWLNTLFNATTTNEIVGGRTRPDGTGEELFEVTTGRESSGLGCGQAVLPGAGGEREIPDCWLVIVPRGSAADENRGTIDDANWARNPAVMTSPLSPAAWENRIAIPLGFNPVDTPCNLNDEQRRIVGSELLVRAVASWQPALCATPGLPPYGYASAGDASARFQLVSGAAGAPGMAVTSRPLPPTSVSPDDPVTYAPLSLSSLVIGFNVERIPDVETAGPDSERLRGVRVAELNLTPRLVAKLLTQSYRQQTSIAGQAPPDYDWAQDNPGHLDQDPDFLRFNPEFELLRPSNTKNFGGLVLAAGTSDAAQQVWEWILADPEARRWLDGEPDEFGMTVNPVYATTAAANRAGVPFGEPVPQTFPKSDPYCYEAPPQGPGGRVVPPALCGGDWLPYASSFRDAAQRTRAANDGARTTRDPEAFSSDRVWRPDGPHRLGTRSMLSLVDSPTAAQYGLQTARLSRAGDNGDGRTFVAPDAAGMAAGVESMAPSDEPAVLVPDPLVQSAAAYPLTALTYAAVTPLSLDEQARAEYAAFIEYAAGDGQVAGLEIGRLPPGYSTLPPSLRDQAIEAAAAIREARRPVLPESVAIPTPPRGAAAAAGPGAPTTPASPSASASATSPSPPADGPGTEAAAAAAPASAVPGEPSGGASGGMTPISALGASRFVLPAVGVLALLSMLGALEITRRPRRAPGTAALASRSAVVIAVALTASLATGGVLATARPALAQERAGELRIVDGGGAPLDGGGSATEYTVAPTGDAECPGDSAEDNYRVYSFMVPVAVAAEDVTYDGLGPTPQVYENYDDFRMPLHDVFTSDFSGFLTAEADTLGGPGRILNIPMLSFAVYRAGDMPLGEYRVGIACTLLNEIVRYWDTRITVSADESDPAGFQWRVIGASPSPGASSNASIPVLPVVFVVAGVAGVAVLFARRARDRSPAPSPLEMP